jgi:hypothetical protein
MSLPSQTASHSEHTQIAGRPRTPRRTTQPWEHRGHQTLTDIPCCPPVNVEAVMTSPRVDHRRFPTPSRRRTSRADPRSAPYRRVVGERTPFGAAACPLRCGLPSEPHESRQLGSMQLAGAALQGLHSATRPLPIGKAISRSTECQASWEAERHMSEGNDIEASGFVRPVRGESLLKSPELQLRLPSQHDVDQSSYDEGEGHGWDGLDPSAYAARWFWCDGPSHLVLEWYTTKLGALGWTIDRRGGESAERPTGGPMMRQWLRSIETLGVTVGSKEDWWGAPGSAAREAQEPRLRSRGIGDLPPSAVVARIHYSVRPSESVDWTEWHVRRGHLP